jgi:hypothetical protein
MLIRLVLVLALLAGISGCSTMAGFFDSDNPGTLTVAGGQMQLLFSNPEFNDLNPSDPLAKSEIAEAQLYGRKNGDATVTGGIGMMEVWRF